MDFLTGKKGYAHFTSSQFRAFVQCVIGSGSYIAYPEENTTPEVLAENTIRIPSMMLIHHGGLFYAKGFDDVVYQNGAQGMKRVDLIVARYSKNTEGLESGEWVVIQGTPDAANPAIPEHTEGNMQQGDLIDDCPVFKVTLNGLNIEKIECLVSTIKPLSMKQNQIQGTNTEPIGGEDGDVFIQFEE